MSLFKKSVAVVMALIIGLSAVLSTFAISADVRSGRPQFMSLSDYKQKLWDEGIPVFTTEQFLSIYNVIGTIFRVVSGQWLFAPERIEVTVDDFVTEACNHIMVNCGLDIVSILTNAPDINDLAEIANKVFEIDTVEFRKQMYDKRDESWANGDNTMANLYYFLGAYFSLIEKCEVVSEPTAADPDVYAVYLRLTYKDGGTDEYRPRIFINTVTGECTGVDGTGLVGIGFNYNLADLMVYATIDGWMREFGFCIMYDLAANSMPLLWHYVTRRFEFEYDGLEWMIQIWKGNYLITNGGEVGLYNRTPDKWGSYYNCATDDQLLEMSLQIYHGDELLVNQEPQYHWWINGFKMCDRMYIPNSLTMHFTIVMPDEEMLNAFCEAMDNHYRKDVEYTVDGLKVSVVW